MFKSDPPKIPPAISYILFGTVLLLTVHDFWTGKVNFVTWILVATLVLDVAATGFLYYIDKTSKTEE